MWRDLRGRDHLEFRWARLGSGLGRIEDIGAGRRRIVVDSRLDRRLRWTTLGHELVHDELDLLWPPGAPPALVQKGEATVERINVDRFVPPDELRALVRQRVDADMTVTVLDVVEEFDVDPDLAREALHRLAS